MSDERLARLAGDGNDAAFAALHRRYDPLLHGYARSIARDADDAADALQNTWIAALIALRADRRSAPVRPWLFRIAHNAAIDVLRRKSSAVRTLDRGFAMAVPGVDEQYDRAEAMAELVGDVRELPTNQRAALVMRELADLEYAEIAIALSTSEGNARQLVFAARDGLRESRAGRALPCESVRGVLSRADRRELRRRRLRAHLDSCQDCRAYADSMARPARKVAGWAPTPAVLQSIFAAAGGSGAAVTQGAPFAGLAKGAIAATLLIAGVGTGEAVVHHGGTDGGSGATAERPQSQSTGQAAGELAENDDPPPRGASGGGADATPTLSGRVIENASARATRSTPAVLRSSGRPAAGARSHTTVRRSSRPSRTNSSQGSRTRPGASAPAEWSPGPHSGNRDAGSRDAGPRGYDAGPRSGGGGETGGDGGPRGQFRPGGAREASSGPRADCPPADGSDPAPVE